MSDIILLLFVNPGEPIFNYMYIQERTRRTSRSTWTNYS